MLNCSNCNFNNSEFQTALPVRHEQSQSNKKSKCPVLNVKQTSQNIKTKAARTQGLSRNSSKIKIKDFQGLEFKEFQG
jgi:hypothetical protein